MPRQQESIKFLKNAFFGFEIFCASISTASTFESGGLIFSLFWDIYQNPMKVGDVAGDVRQGPNHGGGSNLPVFTGPRCLWGLSMSVQDLCETLLM